MPIDPLSVATHGYIESPSTPSVELKRDALRIATLGWVILDFRVLPDPNQETEVFMTRSCVTAVLNDASSTFFPRAICSTAKIENIDVDVVFSCSSTTFTKT
jgi:hypothetical protein